MAWLPAFASGVDDPALVMGGPGWREPFARPRVVVATGEEADQEEAPLADGLPVRIQQLVVVHAAPGECDLIANHSRARNEPVS